jgi:hypothetical protein
MTKDGVQAVRPENGHGDAQEFRATGSGVVLRPDMPEQVCSAKLAARSVLRAEYSRLHREMLTIVRKDEIRRRLMTTPGVGPLVAIAFKKPPSATLSRIENTPGLKDIIRLPPALVDRRIVPCISALSPFPGFLYKAELRNYSAIWALECRV